MRGGARPNSGPKLKYGEPLKAVTFRCPISKLEELKKLVKDQLKEWENK